MTTTAWGHPEAPAGEPPQDTDLIGLGRRIRSLRKDRGLTLGELAARSGTAASQLSVIENGRREPRLFKRPHLPASRFSQRKSRR